MTPSHPRAGEERRWETWICPRHGLVTESEVSWASPGPYHTTGDCFADVERVQVMPVPSNHQPARLGPEPEVEASSKESFVVALEREELEALLAPDHEPFASFRSAQNKFKVALSEPWGGA